MEISSGGASVPVLSAEPSSNYDGDMDMSRYRAILSALVIATVEDVLHPVPEINMGSHPAGAEPPGSDEKARARWLKQRTRREMAQENRESALRWINGYPLVLGCDEDAGGQLLYFDDACDLLGLPANRVRDGIRTRPQEILEHLRLYRNGLVQDCASIETEDDRQQSRSPIDHLEFS